MGISGEIKDLKQVIEKIVFDEGELDQLKIAIRNFNEGIITPKQLKQNLLNCRGRMVEEVLDFLSLYLVKTQTKVDSNFTGSNQTKLANDELRERIAERNALLEIVAKKINSLVLKTKKGPPTEADNLSLDSEEAIKNEIERIFSAIRVDEWLEMCGYSDYKFYVKLYNKLQVLYRLKFGDDGKKLKDSKNAKVEQEIMAGKIAKLNFPEDLTTELIRYIAIRNNAEHDNYDLTPSDMEIAHNAFVRLFIYLITSNLDAQLLAGNEKSFYDCLHRYFSSQLENNSKFLERIERSLNSLFHNFK